MSDLIERQIAIDALKEHRMLYCDNTPDTFSKLSYVEKSRVDELDTAIATLVNLPSAQSKSTKKFVKLVVEYPDPELCTYKEYKGKPYYSIKYIENNETYVGYGTYNPEVLSQYLKEYFISSAQSEIIKCKDCKYFELDHFEKVDGFPIPIIVAHEICMKWGNGCRSNINGWCFMAERKTDERLNQ